MKRITDSLLSLCLLLFLSGCIDEFRPKGIDQTSDILVVEGTITDQTTTIRLSTSVGINDTLTNATQIHYAVVNIECDNGSIFKASEYAPDGNFRITNGKLLTDAKYRLRIEYNGKEYQSTFLTPVQTPEIDSVSVLKKAKGEPVIVSVSTHDSQNDIRYYRWSFKEIWEINATMFTDGRINDDGSIEYYDHLTSNNRYYCWDRDSSKTLLLASSELLTSNTIHQKKLMEFSPSDSRISVLYYINVRQNMIRKEAYDYFTNLQKNIEQTGSIFAPIPSEMKGNITCTTDPDLPVIGYIEVSKETVLERFISPAGLYETPFSLCEEVEDPMLLDGPYNIVSFEPIRTYAPLRCIDCLYLGGKKNRPDFWPNDHK